MKPVHAAFIFTSPYTFVQSLAVAYCWYIEDTFDKDSIVNLFEFKAWIYDKLKSISHNNNNNNPFYCCRTHTLRQSFVSKDCELLFLWKLLSLIYLKCEGVVWAVNLIPNVVVNILLYRKKRNDILHLVDIKVKSRKSKWLLTLLILN